MKFVDAIRLYFFQLDGSSVTFEVTILANDYLEALLTSDLNTDHQMEKTLFRAVTTKLNDALKKDGGQGFNFFGAFHEDEWFEIHIDPEAPAVAA